MENFLPYGRQSIDDEDIDAVVKVLKSDFLTTGPEIEKFEVALAEKINSQHAISTSNGTTALHMATLAAGISKGDKVIVPSVTFVATANMPRLAGAEIVFADVDPENGLMTPENLEDAINKAGGNIKASFPVHLAGQCTDMENIQSLTQKAGGIVIADCCHAIGTAYSGTNKGFVGDGQFETMACFSFHPVKTIAMGEGGAVTTSSQKLENTLKKIRNHGLTKKTDEFLNKDLAFDKSGQVNPWYYEMPDIGHNFRATDIACALGRSQLTKLDQFVSKRMDLASYYDEKLEKLDDWIRPIKRESWSNPVWHLYSVLLDYDKIGLERAEVMARLREKNIGSQVHYIPVHKQPYYIKRYGELCLKGADQYYEKTLSLPLFPAMENEDVERVVCAIEGLIG